MLRLLEIVHRQIGAIGAYENPYERQEICLRRTCSTMEEKIQLFFFLDFNSIILLFAVLWQVIPGSNRFEATRNHTHKRTELHL